MLLAPFCIRSDSLSVAYLASLKDKRSPTLRYFQILSDFCFLTEHRPGRLNAPDDTVSRRNDLPEMDRFEKDLHSAQSYVEQINPTHTQATACPNYSMSSSSLEYLQHLADISIDRCDPHPELWQPNAQHQPKLCQPQDLVVNDIAKQATHISSCIDKHHKLSFLNEIQEKFRGVRGEADNAIHLIEKVPRKKVPRIFCVAERGIAASSAGSQAQGNSQAVRPGGSRSAGSPQPAALSLGPVPGLSRQLGAAASPPPSGPVTAGAGTPRPD